MAIVDKITSYVFVVPIEFNQIKDLFVWKQVSNISFDMITAEEMRGFTDGNMITNNYRITCSLKKRVNEYKPSKVFCLHLRPLALILPFMIKDIKVSGIVYRLPSMEENTLSWDFMNYIEFNAYAKAKIFDRVYLLNAETIAKSINHVFKVEKFLVLLDPYLQISSGGVNIREYYEIPENVTLFSHLGAMEESKGTIDILQSIDMMAEKDAKSCCFLFAGKVGKEIRDTFYSLVDKVSTKSRIIIEDRFCEYSFLGDICKACDAILIPYHRTNQSSGIIGYAAQFHKPVIAPSEGLLGQLVRQYHLGYLMKAVNADNLIAGYSAITARKIEAPNDDYCKRNSVSAFIEIIERGLHE